MRSGARSVPLFATLVVVTIAVGLATRRMPELFPPFIAQYAGDTLWATNMFWLLALAWRRASTERLAAIALAISVAVECSQLYRAHWIEVIRRNDLAALVLGSGFLWSDFVCYAAGVLIAALIDRVIRRTRQPVR